MCLNDYKSESGCGCGCYKRWGRHVGVSVDCWEQVWIWLLVCVCEREFVLLRGGEECVLFF
jgi:hypothetical protein